MVTTTAAKMNKSLSLFNSGVVSHFDLAVVVGLRPLLQFKGVTAIMKHPNTNTNQYVLKEDYAILRITSRTKGIFDVLIDIEDIEKCKKYTWGLIKNINDGTYRPTNYKVRNLNRFILGLNNVDRKSLVEHKNNNWLDCRKKEMKIITAQEKTLKYSYKNWKRNEYILKDDIAIIKINSKKHGYFEAIIDIEDYNKIKDYTWGICKHHNFNIYYVKSCKFVNRKLKQYQLQRIIMDCPKGYVVDHIDHNPLNNRKSNLRICTIAENGMNRKPNYNNTSGITGVSWRENEQRWVAHFKTKEKKFCKRFKTKAEAVEQRRVWEKTYWTEENFLINENKRKGSINE